MKECPILLEGDFQGRFPNIVEVAKYLYQEAEWRYKATGKFEIFDKLSISTISQYIDLVKDGDPDAITTYNEVKNIKSRS